MGATGGYDSDSEDDIKATTAVKTEVLPMPEILIKREVTVEAPSQVKQEEPPPWKEEQEEVDYTDSDDSSSWHSAERKARSYYSPSQAFLDIEMWSDI